jgi:predicted dithiol-disulfide oxidoreductase (DUF899 family)
MTTSPATTTQITTTHATTHLTGSREEWLTARLGLLDAEKELTRRSDELARRRLELPWVRIEKDYRFDTDDGEASLKDLFRGRSQLIVYHFMYGPDWTEGCPSCSAVADGFAGSRVHLENHDVAMTAVSRAPLAQLQAYRARMGWDFPWASSFGSDFNFDFDVSFTEDQIRAGAAYNFRRLPPTDPANLSSEAPGMSAFALQDGDVYHTYSAYSRGVDALWGMYQWLDRAPRGRNDGAGGWFRRHDDYDAR